MLLSRDLWVSCKRERLPSCENTASGTREALLSSENTVSGARYALPSFEKPFPAQRKRFRHVKITLSARRRSTWKLTECLSCHTKVNQDKTKSILLLGNKCLKDINIDLSTIQK
jgi:hypothetical protein